MSNKKIRAIVPAAGKGTRLHTAQSDAPKALRTLCNKPMIDYVLENLDFIANDDIYIVVGYKGEQIRAHLGEGYHFVEQEKQLGTGHAVMICEPEMRDWDGTILVTFGDMPLFRKEILQKVCLHLEKTGAACTLLTVENKDLADWARVVRKEDGTFSAIVEGKDCTPEQAQITELFAGVLAFDSRSLFKILPQISCENAQGEYYLTEVPECMQKAGMRVETIATDDPEDLCGVNRPEDIAVCEAILKKRGKA